jgi:hypothetical protein
VHDYLTQIPANMEIRIPTSLACQLGLDFQFYRRCKGSTHMSE